MSVIGQLGQILMAELVGAAITVLVIDRWYSWRERRRIRPVLLTLYPTLFEFVDRLLYDILPAPCWTVKPYVLRWGTYRVNVINEINPLKESELQDHWINEAKAEVELAKIRAIREGGDSLSNRPEETGKTLAEAAGTFRELLVRCQIFAEYDTDLFHLLYMLMYALTDAQKWVQVAPDSPGFPETYAVELSKVAEVGKALRDRLERLADRKSTIEEDREEWKREMEEMRRSMNRDFEELMAKLKRHQAQR